MSPCAKQYVHWISNSKQRGNDQQPQTAVNSTTTAATHNHAAKLFSCTENFVTWNYSPAQKFCKGNQKFLHHPPHLGRKTSAILQQHHHDGKEAVFLILFVKVVPCASVWQQEDGQSSNLVFCSRLRNSENSISIQLYLRQICFFFATPNGVAIYPLHLDCHLYLIIWSDEDLSVKKPIGQKKWRFH
jgi:hypothetical protein